VVALARAKGIEMPICQAVNALVTGTLTVSDAVESLLSRPLRPETDEIQ
jgi:glycerol-3-phosphate dehydrogenase (NAD(P)+)